MNGGDLNSIRAVIDKNALKDISIMANELKAYCKEHGYDNPKFWPASCTKDYAVSIRMRDNDRWEEYRADVVFLSGEHCNNEAILLGQILEKLQDPVILIVPLALSVNPQSLYKSLGFLLVPARWTNNQNQEEHEVYIKGQMSMGGFVNLMERGVESIANNLLTIRRPIPIIFFSFISFKLSQVLH
jgi:hypothetical protein